MRVDLASVLVAAAVLWTTSACTQDGGDGLAIAWSYRTPSLDARYADREEQVYFDETTVLGMHDRHAGGHRGHPHPAADVNLKW